MRLGLNLSKTASQSHFCLVAFQSPQLKNGWSIHPVPPPRPPSHPMESASNFCGGVRESNFNSHTPTKIKFYKSLQADSAFDGSSPKNILKHSKQLWRSDSVTISVPLWVTHTSEVDLSKQRCQVIIG